MGVNIDINESTGEVKISISGRFDFDMHEEYGRALEKIQGKSIKKCNVDLGAVSEIDSSALGMLLLLREQVGGDKAQIELTRASHEIKEELVMANLSSMFKIV